MKTPKGSKHRRVTTWMGDRVTTWMGDVFISYLCYQLPFLVLILSPFTFVTIYRCYLLPLLSFTNRFFAAPHFRYLLPSLIFTFQTFYLCYPSTVVIHLYAAFSLALTLTLHHRQCRPVTPLYALIDFLHRSHRPEQLPSTQ